MKLKMALICLCFLLVGCNSKEQPHKVDNELLNNFPTNVQDLIEDVNPDIVSMKYLTENFEKYETELGSDRNDFFVIVKGIINDIEVTDYSQKDLSIMSNKDATELLENTISYEFYLDDCKTPLGHSIQQGEDYPDVATDKEYYFFVTVRNLYSDEYSFNIIEIFNLN